jgi:hypothetical protein
MPGNFTSGYWRDRAEEARVLALQMTDYKLREQMLEVARTYEKMAEYMAKQEKWPTLSTGRNLHY